MKREIRLIHYIERDDVIKDDYPKDLKIEVSFNVERILDMVNGFKLFLNACEFSQSSIDKHLLNNPEDPVNRY